MWQQILGMSGFANGTGQCDPISCRRIGWNVATYFLRYLLIISIQSELLKKSSLYKFKVNSLNKLKTQYTQIDTIVTSKVPIAFQTLSLQLFEIKTTWHHYSELYMELPLWYRYIVQTGCRCSECPSDDLQAIKRSAIRLV